MTTSWWRCPRWKMYGEVPFGWHLVDGNSVREQRDQMWSRIWQSRVGTVLRDLRLEQLFVTCRGSCGQTSEVGSTSSIGRTETSERRGYDVVQATHDAYKLPVSGPSRLVICCRPSGTEDEKSHDEGPRGTQTCWTLLERVTSWINCD